MRGARTANLVDRIEAAEAAIQHPRRLAEERAVRIADGRCEVGMVEQIEYLQARLQCQAGREAEATTEPEVHLPRGKASERVAAERPVPVSSRNDERRRIEPAPARDRRVIHVEGLATDDVRPHVESEALIVGDHRHRQRRMGSREHIDGPVLADRGERAGGTEDGQIVAHRRAERVPHIEVRGSLVEACRPNLPRQRTGKVVDVARCGVGGQRPRVRRQRLQSS